MDLKVCLFTLFLLTICHGKDTHISNQKPTSENPLSFVDMKQSENTTLTSLALKSNNSVYRYDDYDYNYRSSSTSQGVVIGVPIGSLLLLACCIYFCCRCRTQRNVGIVMTPRPPPPQIAPPTQIIIQQQAPPPMAGVSPPYAPQQHKPPPYDTQPMWNPPPQDQQYHQQAPPQHQYNQQMPTAYDNPNYGQPPANPKY